MQAEKKVRNYRGLNKSDVQNSKAKFGMNRISRGRRKSFLNHYLESFGDPTIKILLVALSLNIIFFIRNFNWFESIGIAVSIILATFVSSISEYGSQLAFERIMDDASKATCKIWRDNELLKLPVTEAVVGDFIQIEPGDKIPADGLLIDGHVDVDQSALNGETKEAHKVPATNIDYKTTNDTNLLNPNLLFNSSVVCQGEGTMLVQAVGDNTFYGHLAKELQEDTQESPLKKRLTDLAKYISRFGYLGALLILFASLFKSIVINNSFNPIEIAIYISHPYMVIQDIIKAVTLSITIIVVAVPEGLPVMITVVLSSNMKKMIKDNVLVRKLVGIETAGSLNVLFTDKTGTITNGKLQVTSFISGDGKVYDNIYELKQQNDLWKLIYISSIYNNSSTLGYDGIKRTAIGGNSTDRALMNFAASYPLPDVNVTTTKSVPFNSSYKYSITDITGELDISLIKGAPEKILPYCSYYYDTNGKKIKYNSIFSMYKIIKEMSSKGIRVLALAVSDKKTDKIFKGKFSDLTLVGIVCIKDELRENVKSSIKDVLNAGIQVIMITGDGKDTAKAIACDAGLIDDNSDESIITSDDLNRLSDKELMNILPSLKVVARALPTDKTRLIRLSQSMGLVVGMTGDGVNDAPALKKADVGFSMGSGTEIAKDASDIVILDDNFSSISKAILYGRTIFKSIRKFIIFQLSINVCAVSISLIGQFMDIDTPITVIQMLWINMVMDTLAGLAFAGEPPLPEYMEEPSKKKNEKIINRYMANQIIFTGTYTSLLCLLFLKIPNLTDAFRYSANDAFLMTGFFALFMFCAIFNSLNARTQRLFLLSNLLKNKAFVCIMTFVSIIQFILLYFGGNLFRTYGLTLKELLIVLSLAVTVIPFDLMRKSILRLRHPKEEVAKFL